MVIGRGVSSTNVLSNSTARSLMIGFNSDIPTLFVGPSNGIGTLGKVGIGTVNPATLLDVSGTFNADGAATFGNNADISGDLTVNGMATFNNTLTVNNKITTSQLQVTSGAAAGKILQSDAAGNASWTDPMTLNIDDGDWEFNGNNIYRMGNVSIGTSIVSAKLTVDGNIKAIEGLTLGNSAPGLYMLSVNANSTNWASVINNTNTSGKGVLIKAGHISYPDNPVLQLADNDGAVKFTVKASGDVNIKGKLAVDQNVDMTFLTVSDKIEAGMIEVKEISKWQDDVFKPEYDLRTLSETERFIKQNGHLPEIPSEADVLENGYNVSEMDARLLQKIEELTLLSSN